MVNYFKGLMIIKKWVWLPFKLAEVSGLNCLLMAAMQYLNGSGNGFP